MLHNDKKLNRYSNAVLALDNVKMSRAEREIAKAYMENAEDFANRLFRVSTGIRSMVEGFGNGCSALKQRARIAFGNLVHH